MSNDKTIGDGDIIVYGADADWHFKRLREMRTMLGILTKKADALVEDRPREQAIRAIKQISDGITMLGDAFIKEDADGAK